VVAWTVFCFVVAVLAHFRINKAMDKIEALRTPESQRIEAIELGPQDCLIVPLAGHLTGQEANDAAERFGIITDGGQVVSTEVENIYSRRYLSEKRS
jgi:hypothetical protein